MSPSLSFAKPILATSKEVASRRLRRNWLALVESIKSCERAMEELYRYSPVACGFICAGN